MNNQDQFTQEQIDEIRRKTERNVKVGFLIVVVIVIIILYFFFSSLKPKTDEKTNINNNTTTATSSQQTTNSIINTVNTTSASNTTMTDEERKMIVNKPSDTEVISYAQTVLSNTVPTAKYKYGNSNYKIVGTGLRYKIEGNVEYQSSTQKFYMIIEFVNSDFEEYDLKSLQIGNTTLY